jgi:hypothetical protein
MALGNSRWQIQTTGGQVRVAGPQLARTIVHFAMSPLATPNQLLSIGDPSAIPARLDSGTLAECCSFTARGGQPQYAMALTPSTPGKTGAVTLNGTGLATIVPGLAPHKLITIRVFAGGALGVMSVQFSTDGGATWGAVVTSTAGWASTPGVRAPGTYAALTFAAGTYVAGKTATVGIDGTVTLGSGWVGAVAVLNASPVDNYEVLVSVAKGGANGVASLVVSLDNGVQKLPPMQVPVGGVVTIPGTGIYLTCSTTGGPFVLGESYFFLAIEPGPSSSDIQAALTAAKASPTIAAAALHLAIMPSSAANAFSAAAVLDVSILDAFNNKTFDWVGMANCPSSSGGMRLISPITGRAHLRPLSWLACERFVETDPRNELAATKPDVQTATGDGSLHVFFPAGATSLAGPGDIVMPSSTVLYDAVDTDTVIVAARGSDLTRTSVFVGGRDENVTPALDDVQINTVRTYGGPLKAYLSITSGAAGWKNLTANASYIDAGAVRGLNVMVAALRPVAFGLLGQRPLTNPDGTIAESAAGVWDTLLDTAVKRSLGLVKGGDYVLPQASFASAKVVRSSQLGQAPKRLDIAYTYQPLGEVTDVSNVVQFSGVLTIS